MAAALVSWLVLGIIGLVGVALLFGLIWWIVSLFDNDRHKSAE